MVSKYIFGVEVGFKKEGAFRLVCSPFRPLKGQLYLT